MKKSSDVSSAFIIKKIWKTDFFFHQEKSGVNKILKRNSKRVNGFKIALKIKYILFVLNVKKSSVLINNFHVLVKLINIIIII